MCIYALLPQKFSLCLRYFFKLFQAPDAFEWDNLFSKCQSGYNAESGCAWGGF